MKGKISFYCEALKVSRQAFYDYLANKNKPWKYEHLAQLIKDILAEDEYNDTYGRGRMHAALKLKYPDEEIPSERTIYLSHNGAHWSGSSNAQETQWDH